MHLFKPLCVTQEIRIHAVQNAIGRPFEGAFASYRLPNEHSSPSYTDTFRNTEALPISFKLFLIA